MASARAPQLFAGIAPTYDRVGAVLSFGQDPRWRRFLVSRIGIGTPRVLDVATGTGLVARELQRSGRAQRVVGLDRSAPMLREGVRGGPLMTPVLGRGEQLPFADDAFDALTVTYLLRYVDDPAATVCELARVVRPGGVVASLEFAVPSGPVWHPSWWLYTRAALPLAGRIVSRDWLDVGRFLGPSIEEFWHRYPIATQLGWWRTAGIGSVRYQRMSLGGGVVIWGVRGS
jgi:demethylmenaquinone methyltransferase/2-methoxy-6-polyprenyl-1,4-benzoquinol methylase